MKKLGISRTLTISRRDVVVATICRGFSLASQGESS